eukprot:GHVH01004630.1.p1 GENE.GHVH01004630.1~~GHVH01004630.1.p1  ORF type:complete len:360 (-),score=62.22 GHVH01004630.1:141-1220(-)
MGERAMLQESFSRQAVKFQKLECQLDKDDILRLKSTYDGLQIAKNIAVSSITSEHDPDVLFYRMKLVRDNKEFSRSRAIMLNENKNYIVGMGDKVVYRALLGNYPVLSILVAEENLEVLTSRLSSPLLSHVDKQVEGLKVLVTTKKLFSCIVGMPLNSVQLMGCLSDLPVSFGQGFSLSDVPSFHFRAQLPPASDRMARLTPPILILDDVRSADNVGVLLRTAFSFGITSIVLTETSSSAMNARSARVSMGAMYHFHLYQTNNIVETIRQLIKDGVSVFGTTPAGSSIITCQPSSSRWALLLGNEAIGASDAAMEACSDHVKIPQLAGDSLSVSHAAAICLYELRRDALRSSDFKADAE